MWLQDRVGKVAENCIKGQARACAFVPEGVGGSVKVGLEVNLKHMQKNKSIGVSEVRQREGGWAGLSSSMVEHHASLRTNTHYGQDVRRTSFPSPLQVPQIRHSNAAHHLLTSAWHKHICNLLPFLCLGRV